MVLLQYNGYYTQNVLLECFLVTHKKVITQAGFPTEFTYTQFFIMSKIYGVSEAIYSILADTNQALFLNENYNTSMGLAYLYNVNGNRGVAITSLNMYWIWKKYLVLKYFFYFFLSAILALSTAE